MATAAETRELELRALVAIDRERATTETLKTYGPELIEWLCASVGSEADAYDAFSWMSEELWKSLVRFDGRCSLRTWCYMLARQGAGRVRNRERARREHLISELPSIRHEVTQIWNTTRRDSYRERSVYAEIREELDEEDQTLLVLRVDRELPWRDIALVMLGEHADADDLTKRAALLRKHFERLKVQLRERAAQRLRD